MILQVLDSIQVNYDVLACRKKWRRLTLNGLTNELLDVSFFSDHKHLFDANFYFYFMNRKLWMYEKYHVFLLLYLPN
jgi:hypothetical protein